MINFFGNKTEPAETAGNHGLDMNNIPRHVAIIMDGNGRWAKRKGMPRSYGHRAGADTLKRIVIAADELGIKVLTVYAFSTENWKRPEEEVSYIMKLMKIISAIIYSSLRNITYSCTSSATSHVFIRNCRRPSLRRKPIWRSIRALS